MICTFDSYTGWLPSAIFVPCQNGCSDGACRLLNCTNGCSAGTVRCNVNKIEKCNDYNLDGCLEWGGEKICESGTCLNDTSCAPMNCTDECSPVGAVRCNKDFGRMEICANNDADSCTEWVAGVACESRMCMNETTCAPMPEPVLSPSEEVSVFDRIINGIKEFFARIFG